MPIQDQQPSDLTTFAMSRSFADERTAPRAARSFSKSKTPPIAEVLLLAMNTSLPAWHLPMRSLVMGKWSARQDSNLHPPARWRGLYPVEITHASGTRDASGCDLAGSAPGSFFRLSFTWPPLVLPRHTPDGLTTSSCAQACASRSHSDAACDGEQGIGPSFRLSCARARRAVQLRITEDCAA